MICPKCGSDNVTVQMVSTNELKKKRHGIFYWLLIGWWLKPILWVCLTMPMIIIKIFRPKKYKMITKHNSMCVCQNCGNSWSAK